MTSSIGEQHCSRRNNERRDSEQIMPVAFGYDPRVDRKAGENHGRDSTTRIGRGSVPSSNRGVDGTSRVACCAWLVQIAAHVERLYGGEEQQKLNAWPLRVCSCLLFV